MRWLTIAILWLPALSQDDQEAEQLYRAFQERIEKAKTLRVEYKVAYAIGPTAFATMDGTLKVKEQNRWSFDAKCSGTAVEAWRKSGKSGSGETITLRYDGRKLATCGTEAPFDAKAFPPQEVGASFRQSLATVLLMPFSLVTGAEGMPTPAPKIGKIRDGGTEKIGEIAARILQYTLEHEGVGVATEVKLFIDPAEKKPLRRVMDFQQFQWVETFTAFAVDEEIPDSDFTFQSKRRLARVQTEQLARSAELFGAFTGRPPRSLEELLRRPSDLDTDIFWPEGGFVLGEKLPADPWGRPFELRVDKARRWVVSRGADGRPCGKGDDEDAEIEVPAVTRCAVAAPSDRLAKHYAARVQLHLLAAAIRAFRDLYDELPRKKADLWEKPEWAEVWPEGGWLPGAQLPTDPWGEPYRMITDAKSVRVQVNDPKARGVSVAQLTSEERKKLDEVAKPRFSETERKEMGELLSRLSDDDIEVREGAQEVLRGWGPAILPVLKERLAVEKDPEALDRLNDILRRLPQRPLTWAQELIRLIARVPAKGGLENDLSRCRENLKKLWAMQCNYAAQYGGPNKLVPNETGKVFWLKLSSPPTVLIDQSLRDLYLCPASDATLTPDSCSYYGPSQDVNGLKDDNPVGMCDDEGHGDEVIILRKSGDIEVVTRDHPLYKTAVGCLTK